MFYCTVFCHNIGMSTLTLPPVTVPVSDRLNIRYNKHMTDKENKLNIMSVDEVCQYLGVSRGTLYRRINAGLIKPLPKQNPMLLREDLRFDRSAVEAFKASVTGESPI